MKIKIGNEDHIVIYIEYQDNIPHDVKTKHYIPNATDGPYWRLYDWDAFANNGNKTDLRLYNSGSGGDVLDELAGPNYVDSYEAKIWHSKEIKIVGGKNFLILDKPLRIKSWKGSTANPFIAGEITNSCEYCDRCRHYSTDFCDLHKYDDEHGNVRYKDDDSMAE